MAMRTLFTALAALAAVRQVAGQTFTDCNPMEKSDCPANPALSGTASFDMSDQANPKVWNMTAGPMKYGKNGAEFTIAERGQSPTIKSEFYIMWGSVSVEMQAASGQGIISSIVLQSEDLDEIDWEFTGTNTTHVQTNFFGKGNTTSFDRGADFPVSNPQTSWHNYTLHWTQEQLQWWVDGQMVRALDYAGKGTNGGNNYPQTPMNVRFGIWAGGDPKQPQGVIDWAGGITDYKDAYTMYVKSVNVTDFGRAKEYVYSDRTGSFQSIKSVQGNSTILKEIEKPTGIGGFWQTLTTGAKSGIVIGAVSGAGVLLAALLICCIVQGRKGKKEKAIADAQWEKEQAEFNQYRMQMMNGQFSKGGFSANEQPMHSHAGYAPQGRF